MPSKCCLCAWRAFRKMKRDFLLVLEWGSLRPGLWRDVFWHQLQEQLRCCFVLMLVWRLTLRNMFSASCISLSLNWFSFNWRTTEQAWSDAFCPVLSSRLRNKTPSLRPQQACGAVSLPCSSASAVLYLGLPEPETVSWIQVVSSLSMLKAEL